jgi:hypothetical protein
MRITGVMNISFKITFIRIIRSNPLSGPMSEPDDPLTVQIDILNIVTV